MKRHFFPLLLLALPLLFLVSCSDNDDLPDVDITVNFEGLYQANGQLYALRDTPLVVNSVTVTPLGSSKEAALGSVRYYCNGVYQGTSALPPFEASFNVAEIPDGPNFLGLEMGVFQVDKSLSWAKIEFKFNVVDDAASLPDGAIPYTNSTAQSSQIK